MVAATAVRYMVVPAGNLMVAWVAVQLGGIDAWGRFVPVQVVITIAGAILAWGHREWLLRQAAETPTALGAAWRRSLGGRSPALAVAMLVGLVAGPATGLGAWPSLWLGAAFLLQAFDPVVVLRRRFATAAGLDAAGLMATAALVWAAAPVVEPRELARAFACGMTLRALAHLACFGRGVSGWPRRIGGLAMLREATPFAALGLAGLAQSRADLWLASTLLEPDALGRYQLLMSMLIVLQATAAYLLMPFLRALYRVPAAVERRIARRLWYWGLVVVLAGVPAIWWVLDLLFDAHLPWIVIPLGMLYVLPTFGYAASIYALYRRRRERAVLVSNLIGTLTSLVGTAILALRFGELGVLTAAVAGQWVVWLVVRSSVLRSQRLPRDTPHRIGVGDDAA
jgi:hypothetical protein